MQSEEQHVCSESGLSAKPGANALTERAWLEVARSLKLSGREVQIARGVFEDQTKGAIAFDLGISFESVNTHFVRLFKKLDVHTRTALVICIMNEAAALTLADNGLPPLCDNRAAGRCPIES